MIGTPWHNLLPMKIVSSEEITGESGRWEYMVQVVEFGELAKDTPTVPTIPSGGPEEYKAYNLYEYSNTSSSHMGIDPDDLPGDYELQPVPNGTIVPAFIANGLEADTSATAGSLIVILYPNQFDGDC